MELKTLCIDGDERIFLDGEEIKNVAGYKLEHSADSSEPAKLTVAMCVKVDRVSSESRFDKMESNDVAALAENALEQCEVTIRQAEESRKISESTQKSYQFLTVICAIMCGLVLVLIGCIISYFATLL